MKEASAPPCDTRVPAAHPVDTLTVVVFDKIDLRHAPWPRNREERFVFSHLYETLVNVDCHGVVQPGIAKSWKKASDGWYIEIEEDAHFWDDTPVTAADIQTSFEPAIRSGIAIGTVDIVDETHAIIHGTRGLPDLALFAQPILAIRKLSGLSGFPMGTGPWQIDTETPTADGITIRPASSQTPVVRFIEQDAGNAKDILNGSADAMITDDPAVIDYARSKTKVPVPLPWDRAYVLIDPVRVETVATGGVVADLPASLCDALARDAVAVDSRGGSIILTESWKLAPLRVEDHEATTHASAGNQIVFVADDPTARGLAERIVALAAMDTSTSAEARAVGRAIPGITSGAKAVGVRSGQFAGRLQTTPGSATFVVALSWNADFPFLASYFQRRAPWLAGVTPASGAFIPLVDTRPHFIAISDRIGFIADKNGELRLMSPGAERVR